MSCPTVSEHKLLQLDQPLQEWDVMKLHFLSIVVPSFFTERKTVAPLGHRLEVEQGVLCSQLPKLPTHPLPSIQELAQGLVTLRFAELMFALVKHTPSTPSFFTFPKTFPQSLWKITPDPGITMGIGHPRAFSKSAPSSFPT